MTTMRSEGSVLKQKMDNRIWRWFWIKDHCSIDFNLMKMSGESGWGR